MIDVILRFTRCHDSLVRQINNVLCFFGKLDSVTKFRLLISSCYSAAYRWLTRTAALHNPRSGS